MTAIGLLFVRLLRDYFKPRARLEAEQLHCSCRTAMRNCDIAAQLRLRRWRLPTYGTLSPIAVANLG
jgi:hypothetical protein